MKIFRFLWTAVAVVYLTGISYSSPVADKGLFAGVNLSYHSRVGYLTYSDNETEAIAREDIPSIGLLIGKRFTLSSRLRLEVPVALNYGAAREDSSLSFDGVIKSSLFDASLVPQLQLPLHIDPVTSLYFSLGSGLHVVRFTEKTAGDYINSFTCPSVSIVGGVGFEKVTGKSRGIAIQYSIRYGKPVYYKYMKDLFPHRELDYEERFITHSIQFIILMRNYLPSQV